MPRHGGRPKVVYVQQPEVVTLCGSVRFAAEFLAAHRRLSLDGCVVLLPDLPASDGDLSPSDIEALGALHRRKIDMSDRVHIVNPGGYVGQSAAAEIAYAEANGKGVTYEYDAT
jgi:predicted phosphodiesterase